LLSPRAAAAISCPTKPPIENEQVDLDEAERVSESDHLPGGRRDRVARLAGRGANAGVVDQDDLALGGGARRSISAAATNTVAAVL
jgi:hypothetical protein